MSFSSRKRFSSRTHFSLTLEVHLVPIWTAPLRASWDPEFAPQQIQGPALSRMELLAENSSCQKETETAGCLHDAGPFFQPSSAISRLVCSICRAEQVVGSSAAAQRGGPKASAVRLGAAGEGNKQQWQAEPFRPISATAGLNRKAGVRAAPRDSGPRGRSPSHRGIRQASG